MKTLKDNLAEILVALFELVLGIILLSRPLGMTVLIVMAMGVALVLFGVGALIKYFKTDPLEAAKGQEMVKGLCMIAGGCFCMFNFDWFRDTLRVLAILYGVLILVTGMSKVQWTVDMVRLNKDKWFLCAIGAAVTILCGIVVILNPFDGVKALWLFIGISLIVDAVVDAVTLFLRLKPGADPDKIVDAVEEEV